MEVYDKQERGFTYIEVVACICIAALVIGPLTYAYLNAVKVKSAASHIDMATQYTEQLMMDVKEQLTDDLILKHKIEGNRLEEAKWKDYRHIREGVWQYVLALSNFSKEEKTLQELFKGRTWVSQLEQRYDTKNYDYEIAIWSIEDLNLKKESFIVDEEILSHAVYFSTLVKEDNEDSPDTGLMNPITFKVDSENYKLFQDQEQTYVPNYNGKGKLLDHNSIIINALGEVEQVVSHYDKGHIIVDGPFYIQSNENKQSYYFQVNEGDIRNEILAQKPKDYVSIIEMDLRKVLIPEQLNIKLTNQTGYNQVICVKQNNEVRRPNIVVEDKNVGKTSIVYEESLDWDNNYIIVITMKEKKPIQGEEGKIIKRMIDIYSYDATIEDRR